MTDVELRPIDRAELPSFYRTLAETFGEDPRDDDRERFAKLFEPERSLAAFDGDQVVSTAGAYTRQMTLPGGPRPVAGVTIVGVLPTHRRRGLLTEMMRRQLTELHERQQEPVAALWASEGGIYGRFGYGAAARQVALSGSKSRMRLRPDVPLGSGRVTLATPEQARPHEIAVYDQVWRSAVGFLERDERWWDRVFDDREHLRGGATARRHALHVEQDGSVTGYATYRLKDEWTFAQNDSEVLVLDVLTTTAPAYTALWSYLAGIDLHPKIARQRAPLDDPLQHMLLDVRALRTEVYDSLWVRLADLGGALAERTYSTDLDVVLEVTDEFCPWNAGSWRLSGDASGARCERSTDAADLTLSAADLAAAFLGGPTLVSLAGTGRVLEQTRGALSATSRAFAADRQPWCPEVF
ncbi:MAG TPA: GNAT family N-acetyltransferase [Mycobacteriales bacterium]|nr:GNAT family N-acetyltransferase [Mycobacteriales bacterium]